MTRPSRRVADYAPSTLERSAELVLAAAVEEAVALLRSGIHVNVIREMGTGRLVRRIYVSDYGAYKSATATLLAAATAAELILGRAR
jgi:hypothetical protein